MSSLAGGDQLPKGRTVVFEYFITSNFIRCCNDYHLTCIYVHITKKFKLTVLIATLKLTTNANTFEFTHHSSVINRHLNNWSGGPRPSHLRTRHTVRTCIHTHTNKQTCIQTYRQIQSVYNTDIQYRVLSFVLICLFFIIMGLLIQYTVAVAYYTEFEYICNDFTGLF